MNKPVNPLVVASRRFLMACGVRVADLKLDYAMTHRIGFLARGAEYDGTAQVTRMVDALREDHGLPKVDFKAGGDCRVYQWAFEDNRVLRVKIWYDEGTIDYGFYVELEDGNLRDAEIPPQPVKTVPAVHKHQLDMVEAARKLGSVFRTTVAVKGN